MVLAGGRVISSLPQRLRLFNQRLTARPVSTSCQHYAKHKQAGAEGSPIPFSSSKAASWSMTNIVAPKRDIPWYQSLSVTLSVMVFMLYFFFLREENDFDMELNFSLFERVPQLEEHQLKVALDYNRREGKDTRELEERLAEIQRDKQLQKEKNQP